MVHKKKEATYHRIEKLMKETPGFLSPWERLASSLDPKQHTGGLLLNACRQFHIHIIQTSPLYVLK